MFTDEKAATSGKPIPPLVIAKPAHPISRQDIDPDALKIIYRLHGHGFIAYVTGGAVRDLLLGKPVNDFDIVTDARPGQIKKRFHNAYIIGRRFRLAHLHFRDGKVIEVATFRRAADSAAETACEIGSPPPSPYGTPAEDAFRRDITINALYYDAITETVIDYVGGLEDVARRAVRVIGDPPERFKEDPVRIWRVLRFAARLGFAIDEPTLQAIPSHIHLLADCAGARLFEEFNKDLTSETRPVVEALRKYGVLKHILGKLGEGYEAEESLYARLAALLESEDRGRTAGFELSLAEMYALIFWPWMEPFLADTKADLHKVLSDAFRNASIRMNIPRSLRADVSQIL
ncbi:MAG: hypothetical protein AB1715_11640, partial [Acidobacteriota bacterium]